MLEAAAPNQVWTWDITKLALPERGILYCLYVIIDLFSRYVVGWLLAEKESAALAKRLFAETLARHGIEPGQLTVHDSLLHGRAYCQTFFGWHNDEHHHDGLALFTPADVFHGRVAEVAARRQAALDAAYAAHPERFPNGAPRVALPPAKVTSAEIETCCGSLTSRAEWADAIAR